MSDLVYRDAMSGVRSSRSIDKVVYAPDIAFIGILFEVFERTERYVAHTATHSITVGFRDVVRNFWLLI